MTPLLRALERGSKVLQNQECLRLLGSENSARLTALDGKDPLYFACTLSEDLVTFLVQSCNAPVDVPSGTSRTVPLQLAIINQMSVETIKQLINSNSVNHRDIFHRTPLHYTALTHFKSPTRGLEIAGALVDAGAKVFVVDIEGRTPGQVAKDFGRDQIKEFLDEIASESRRFEPFDSFAPPRTDAQIQFLVDGEETFKTMAEAMRSATHTIYLSDWWLSPQLYLLRHGTPDEILSSRLDVLLDTLCRQRQIDVYILLWENVEQIEPLKSEWTQKHLQHLNPKIHVMRHSSPLLDGNTHHQKFLVIDHREAFVGGLDLCLHRWDNEEHSLRDDNPLAPLFPGKDFYNPLYIRDKDPDYTRPYDCDYQGLDRSIHPRMPWHDVMVRISGSAAYDVSRNFVQRWNFIRSSNTLFLRDSTFPSLEYPKEEDADPQLNIDRASGSATRRGSASGSDVRTAVANGEGVRCQIVRSIGRWASGVKRTETSVANAIRDAIREAETFVYIETQFLISTQGKDLVPSLADVIIQRVRRAFDQRTPFHIVVVLPMFPEGDPTSDKSKQRIMFWQKNTIDHIEREINAFTRGYARGASDYISFYSLANHALMQDRIVSEQIYVHSKLLISDSLVIIGSANLNMRSLVGHRDSEIAAVIEDPNLCQQLRRRLWMEHLGSSAVLSSDVMADFEKQWLPIAIANTNLYKNMFEGSTPLSEALSAQEFVSLCQEFHEVWAARRINLVESYDFFRSAVRGHLVLYPRRFLSQDTSTLDASLFSLIFVPFSKNAKDKIALHFPDELFQ